LRCHSYPYPFFEQRLSTHQNTNVKLSTGLAPPGMSQTTQKTEVRTTIPTRTPPQSAQNITGPKLLLKELMKVPRSFRVPLLEISKLYQVQSTLNLTKAMKFPI
jgi:hypothetical protein